MKVTTTVDLSGFRPSETGKGIARQIGPRVAQRVERLKTRLREDARGALGARLANTWRGEVYPVSRPTRTLNPAGLVTSKASEVVQSFDPGATIKAAGGRYLAIPTAEAGVKHTTVNNKRLTPAIWQEETGRDLVFVKLGAVAALISKGRYVRQPKRWRRRKSFRPIRLDNKMVVIFILVPVVRLRKRLDWRRIIATETAGFESDIRQGVSEALRSGGRP